MSRSAPVRSKNGRTPVQRPAKSNRDLPALKVSNRELSMLQQDAAVLSLNDMERILYQLNKKKIESESFRRAEAERLALHEMSLEKVKTWSNTVLGSRQKKLAARKAREEQEEKDRVLVDIEEAKLQAQQRKEVIEMAKCKQYYQTDRVKGFHSALLLTEVLKERDAQVEVNNLKRNRHVQSDIEYRNKVQQDYLDSINKDNAENKQRRDNQIQTVNYQLEQIENAKKIRNAEKEQEIREAEEIKMAAAQHEAEERKKADQRALDARNNCADYMRQMEDIKQLRYIQQLHEEEEDEQCRMFAAAKKKMMKMRLEKEQQMADEKLKKLDDIRDLLASQIKEKFDDEDARIKRATEEIEARTLKEEQDKEEKRRRDYKAIQEHTAEDAKYKKKLAEEQRLKDLAIAKVREDANEIIAANENEKQRRRLEEALKFSKFHLDDVEERRRILQRQRENDLELYQRDRDLAEVEEAQFQKYARSVIEHCDKRGRNVIPLEKAAREGQGGGQGQVFPGRGPLRPSYLSVNGTQLGTTQRYSTDEVKQKLQGEAGTTQRLGFVY